MITKNPNEEIAVKKIWLFGVLVSVVACIYDLGYATADMVEVPQGRARISQFDEFLAVSGCGAMVKSGRAAA